MLETHSLANMASAPNMDAHRTLQEPTSATSTSIRRIAVGVDGSPEGRDAACLGALLAGALDARLTLVAIHPTAGRGTVNMDTEATRMLERVRAAIAPQADITTEADASVARGLHRVTEIDRHQLLVLGSSPTASDGHTRIGKRTRQLLCDFRWPIAIAPSGMHKRTDHALRRIGVGYDGDSESDAALDLAVLIARTAGAQVQLLAVVDDRVPVMLRSALTGLVKTEWNDAVWEEERRLRTLASAASETAGVASICEVLRGRPADALLELSRHVDMLVIGSRRWGPASRALLGSTGEPILHDAESPVLVVPRPGRGR
jgi:nucleotide-binding universal stress UspA family protein